MDLVYWKPALECIFRSQSLLNAFKTVAERFMTETLVSANEAELPENTVTFIMDFSLQHGKGQKIILEVRWRSEHFKL